jgi:hypothetical protein
MTQVSTHEMGESLYFSSLKLVPYDEVLVPDDALGT